PSGFNPNTATLSGGNTGVADSILVYATKSLHLYSDSRPNTNSGSLQSIRFSLGTSGSSTPLTRMIITSSGATTRVGIGDFWQTNSSQPLYPQNTLEVRGGITVVNITASNIPSASNANVLLYNSASGVFTYISTSSLVPTNAFLQGGNSFGTTAVLGTNDAQNLQFETNNTVRMTISGSNGFVGVGTASPTEQLHVNGNMIVTGRITAEEFHTEFVSASIIYQSGSTQFGNSLDDTHIFTGSLRVNGSITGSLFGTASWATNALTASFLTVGTYNITASWAQSASNAVNAQTASFLSGAFLQNGNSFGTTAVLGTNDNQNLQFETNGSVRMTISSSGRVGIGTTSPTAQLETTEDIIVNGVNIGNGGGDQATNTRVGAGALANNITGVVAQRNTAVGYLGLNANTDGADNTALGNIALQANVNGILNTAVGSNALKLATTNENTAIGASSLFNNTGGTSNTAVGAGALYENVNGDNNIAVGAYAGRYLSNGSTANATSNQSIFIGNATKASGSIGTNEIVIGYDAIGAGDNSIVLGNTSTTKTILRSGVGIGLSNTQTPSNTLQVSGSLWTTTITASNIPFASNANVLLYNSASGQFSYLSTSSIGNISGTGTPDRVVLWNTANSINDDAELSFDRTNNILTVGTSTFGTNTNVKGNLIVDDNTTLGNASTDTASINAGRVNILNLPAGTTELAVLVTGSGGQVFTRAIDSRTFGTTLVDGSGTQNYITRWSSGTSITTSSIYESGSRIGIGVGAVLPNAVLHISGANNSNLLEVDSVSKTNILFVSGSGLVGIGTGTPQADLHISTSQAQTNTAFLVHGTNKDSASFSIANSTGIVQVLTQGANASMFLRTMDSTTPSGFLLQNNTNGATEGGMAYIPSGFNPNTATLSGGNTGVADSILVYATKSLHL
ncbi:MAG: hypothetical protein EBU90_26270, partial [Proteobacteria bacterium]|nr:hypothetical protein [Pseudomonadota bacterium]